MSVTVSVVLACVFAYVLKLAGYVIPARLVEGERTSRITALIPVALLCALVIVQTFAGDGGRLSLDARAIAVVVALALLALRANFLVVVLAAAATAAGLRAAGWG